MDCITIDVVRRDGEAWGVQISGEGPCHVETVTEGSPAAEAGLEIGDYLISVNGVSVYDASHEHVVKLIGQCGKIARFRILPNQKESTNAFNSPDSQSQSLHVTSSSDDESNCTKTEEDEHSKEYLKQDEKKVKSTEYKSYDIQVHYDKATELRRTVAPTVSNEILVEQSGFIVTRENQKQFDEHYQHEGNFAGRKATVAGAFTGDFNVIRSPKEENDIVGVKSRVLAGIQHFSFSEGNEKIAEEDRGKIILYTTSLGIHRSVAHRCEEARKILIGFRVKFEVRDVFHEARYKDELFKRLGVMEGDKMPTLPRLYIDGVCAGGFDEIEEMSDCGDLRIRFQDFPKFNVRQHCSTCEASGIIICKSCNGKGFRQKNRFTTLKCGSCQQKGTLSCPDCL